MKTNQIMIRDNEGFIQRTQDSYFNATALLDIYNAKNGTKKFMGNYKAIKTTKEFILQLNKEGIADPFLATRGRNSGTWMHPKLFIDFAMWLSVEFKSIVIDYVLDGLIKSRHDAGDYYNEMCAATLEYYIVKRGTRPTFKEYSREANLITVTLGLKGKDRNLMTEDELNKITQLQKLNTVLLKKGIGPVSRQKHLQLYAQAL